MALPTTFLVDKFKPMKITKVDVVFADKPGRNRNVYSTAVLKEAIDYYKKLIALDPTYKYSFAKHPKDSDEEWIGLIAGAIDDIYFNSSEGTVQADFTLLPTVWGQFIAWLLSNEYHVGISLRGKAESQPSTMEIGGNLTPINQRFNLKLEGVDFVVYPSYIVTNASKQNITEKSSDDATDIVNDGSILPHLCLENTMSYSEVLESFIKDISDEYGILPEDIKSLLTIPANNKVVEETLNMDELQVREAKLQVDRLTVDKDKLTGEIASLKEEFEKATNSIKEKETAIADLDSKISDRQQIVVGLNQLEERLKTKTTELSELESKVTEAVANYDKLSADYAELVNKAEKQTIVHIAGKTFSVEAPPKIRLVDVSEKTTDADWSIVNQDKLGKLVSLSDDAELASKVFAVSEGLKYPVYQAFKSSSPEHDVDLVLNDAALKNVADELVSYKALAMTAEQKTKALDFLKSKYTELEAAGINEVPKSLKDTTSRTAVLSKLKFDDADTFSKAVIESAIFNGLVTVTPKNTVKESVEGEATEDDTITINSTIAHDNLVAAITNTLLGINRGKSISKKVTEETTNSSTATTAGTQGGPDDTTVDSNDPFNSFIDALVTAPDGSPTDFSDAFGIQTPSDFMTKYVGPLNDAISSGDFMTALGMIQMAVSTYTQAMVDASDDTNVSDYISTAFMAIASTIQSASNSDGSLGPQDASNNYGSIPTNQNINNGSTGTSPVTEQNAEGDDEDMPLFNDLKGVLETKFEGVTIGTPAELLGAVQKLVSDYEQTYADMQALQFVNAKREKTQTLIAAGVTEETINNELTAATTIEDLEAITAKLIAEIEASKTTDGTEVTESVKADATDVVEATETQKSHATVTTETVVTESAGMSMFKKVMGSI